jgi:CHAT domain-containing protein/Tfp pilus assembly protein PilF
MLSRAVGDISPQLSETFEGSGARVQQPLEPDKSIERQLRGGEVHAYRLSLERGEFLHVVAEQRGVDVILTLFGPDTKQIKRCDSSNGAFGPESLSVIANNTGDYRLEISSFREVGIGRYVVQSTIHKIPTADDKRRIMAEDEYFAGMQLQAVDTAEARKRAIVNFKKAAAIWRLLGDSYEQAMTIANLGREYDRLSRKKDALHCYEQALPIQRSVNDDSGEARTLGFIAHVYSDLGKKQLALEYYSQALTIHREVGDRALEARMLNSIGLVYSDLGEMRKALEFYLQALPVERAMGDRSAEGKTLTNIGLLYSSLGESQKALEYYDQALPIERTGDDHSLEAVILRGIGFVYQQSGERQKALEYYQSALKLQRVTGDRTREARTLNYIANVHNELGERQNALDYYNKGLVVANAVGNIEQSAEILCSLMSYWKEGQKPQLAIFFGKQAVNAVQQMRSNIQELDKDLQKSFLSSKAKVYHDLADLLIEQGRLSEAQEVIDLMKEQQFHDFTRGDAGAKSALRPVSRTQLEQKMDAQYQQETKGLMKTYDDWSKAGSAAEKERLGKQLDEGFNQFQSLFDKLDSILQGAEKQKLDTARNDIKGLRNLISELDPGAVVLYTLVVHDHYRVILIRGNHALVEQHTLIKAEELRRQAQQFVSLLSHNDSDTEELLKASSQLYTILIAPIAQDLKDADAHTLIWQLDDVLHYIPMGALYDAANKQFLVESYASVIKTPASTYNLSSIPQLTDARLLAMGLSQSYGGFPALSNVKLELSSLVQDPRTNTHGLLAGSEWLNNEFTEKTLQDQLSGGKYKVVHIASHFKADPSGDDTKSFLLLAGKDVGGLGFPLTLHEFASAGLEMKGVDLLTLSACKTALASKASDGHEIDGLGGVGQQQGAKAVLASLWEVDDQSTGLLMRDFYKLWIDSGGKLGKAEALRQAQLDMLRGKAVPDIKDPSSPTSFAHPYYWAPFVLMGNWR